MRGRAAAAMGAATLDSQTGLPLLSSIRRRVREELRSHGELGFLFFDVAGHRQLVEALGLEKGREVLAVLGRSLHELRGSLYREQDLLALETPGGSSFVLFLLSPPRQKKTFSNHDLKLVRYRIKRCMADVLEAERTRLGLEDVVELHSGYTVMQHRPRLNIGRAVADAVKEAALRAQLDEIMAGFVSNVSHELRTPLTCIEGYAETLLEGAKDDPVLCERWLRIIFEEAQRLERLIKDLLDLSMVEAHHLQMRMRSARLEKMVEDTVLVLQPHARKNGITLQVRRPGPLPPVLADEDRIRQVLLNLVDNAIKYSEAGSEVTVAMVCEPSWVRVEVSDQGFGIPQADLDRIFDRFYRVDKGRAARVGGRGLGLAIAKHFIEAHGGTIEVVSQPQKGSTFTFTLRIDDGTAELEDDD
jgi:signal transduction histidine kinase